MSNKRQNKYDKAGRPAKEDKAVQITVYVAGSVVAGAGGLERSKFIAKKAIESFSK